MAAALIHAEFGYDCDLYGVLCVKRTATSKEIKRAYHKLALKYHPDKQHGNEATRTKATAKFQALCAIHSILSDKCSRAAYDDSGIIDSNDLDYKSTSYQMWTQYFACVFPKVSKEKILKFENEYRFSSEEKCDVLAAYTKYEGEFKHVMHSIMLSTEDDEERFAEMIHVAIKENKVKKFPKWREYVEKQTKMKNRKTTSVIKRHGIKRRKKEACEAEELYNAIRGNQQQRDEDSVLCFER
ncbi:hypothetical protein CCR75_005665 [Bremia lactucae]|uniref:J domain-containing protein n=1 Tax=Bremia lactucae TaxID=4779 RepID=A0A976FKN7_BRELC|nr:hypothetical protein CCR75_005665 [Bremia lactucae]